MTALTMTSLPVAAAGLTGPLAALPDIAGFPPHQWIAGLIALAVFGRFLIGSPGGRR